MSIAILSFLFFLFYFFNIEVDVGGNLDADDTKGSSKSSSGKSSKSSSGRDSSGGSGGQGSSSNSNNSSSNAGTPSLDARAKFGSSIFYLSGMELGHVMSVIELECPTVLKNWGTASVEINVDEIPPKIFASLNSYILSKVGNKDIPESPEDETKSRKKRKSG